jgi:hypothetical protein
MLMQRRIPTITSVALALALGFAISCSKDSTRTPPPPSAPSTPRSAPLAVVDVDLGRSIGGDKRVTEKLDTFGPNDTIYASVRTTGSAANAKLRARWTYEDGQVVDESEQPIAPTGDAATEFHISKPDGWPPGKYKLEVFLNGAPARSKEFEVAS